MWSYTPEVPVSLFIFCFCGDGGLGLEIQACPHVLKGEGMEGANPEENTTSSLQQKWLLDYTCEITFGPITCT